MKRYVFAIIALVFFIWYSSCQIFMFMGYVADIRLVKTLTTASIAFLGTSTMGVLFLYDDIDKKYLGVCILAFISSYLFILLSYWSIDTDIRIKIASIGIACVFSLIFDLIKDARTNK